MSCRTTESSFLVLNDEPSWRGGLPINLEVTAGGLSIKGSTEFLTDLEVEVDSLSKVLTVTDFAVGRCSLIYILDSDRGALWVYEPRQKYFERIECFGLPLGRPSAVAFTPGTLFIADERGENRLYALAEVNWQIRWTVGPEPASADGLIKTEESFRPIDLAVDADGNLYALDASNTAVLKFDEAGRLVSIIGRDELRGHNPVSIAVSPDGLLYVLDALDGKEKVLRFDARTGRVVNASFIVFEHWKTEKKLPLEFAPSVIAVRADGALYVGDRHINDRLHEDDRFISVFDTKGEFTGIVGGFRGAVERLAVDAENRVYVFNREMPQGDPLTERLVADTAPRARIVVLKPTDRYARLEGTSLVAGTYFSHRFDSASPRTRWHKFVLDADIPSNTQIRVSYLVDEQKGDTDARLLDVTRTLAEKNASYPWSEPVANATDALVGGGEGRYLWLRIELIGSETSTPTLRSVRVEFPRTSYLRYLPAVYQEDARSRDFLERFLSVFETFFGRMEREIASTARLFDPEAARSGDEFLRWVATWLAVAVDQNWDTERLRKLVRRAPELYRKRGTREGLEEYIETFTGERPLIVEKFQIECDGMLPEVAKLFGELFGNDPYCFCVLLKPCTVRTDEERQAVARLLDAEKPAHTCAGLLTLQPWVYLDAHTYLGVNTYLSEPDLRLDTGATMPRDTMLADAEEAGQLGTHSRLGVDTTIT